MLSRRDFLKSLLSTVATTALIKRGIVQPEQAIAEPKRTVFDMAANTWRESANELHVQWVETSGWSFKFDSPLDIRAFCVYGGILPDEMTRKIAGAMASLEEDEWLKPRVVEVKARYRSPLVFPSWGITAEEVQARIDEYASREDEILHGVSSGKLPTGFIRLNDGIPT